jgi:hypothetical protein
MYIGVHVKFPFVLSDFNKTGIFSDIHEKYSNIKFQENPSRVSPALPCGRTARHETTSLFVILGTRLNMSRFQPQRYNTGNTWMH